MASSNPIATAPTKIVIDLNVSFFSLPDEVLLQIASTITPESNGRWNPTLDLRHFALTHRRFRDIAHQALISKAMVPVRNIGTYAEMLQSRCQESAHMKMITLKTETGCSEHRADVPYYILSHTNED